MLPDLIITKSNSSCQHLVVFYSSTLLYCLLPTWHLKVGETMHSQELGETGDMTYFDLLPTKHTSRTYSLLYKMDITQKSLTY